MADYESGFGNQTGNNLIGRSGLTALYQKPSNCDLAEKYRAEMQAALDVVCRIMGEASRNKFEIQFSLGADAIGTRS